MLNNFVLLGLEPKEVSFHKSVNNMISVLLSHFFTESPKKL